MTQGFDFFSETINNQEQAAELISRLYEVAQPDQAFSAPVTQGQYAVITAAEVSLGLGMGYGGGGGSMTDSEESEVTEASSGSGYGLGGGGGGVATARPVAAIEIGPNGVTVQPIVDATKIALAMFTTVGSMALMFARMSRRSR